MRAESYYLVTGVFGSFLGVIILFLSGFTTGLTIFCAFFASSIARLSIIFTNSFHDPHRVFKSAISLISAPAVAL